MATYEDRTNAYRNAPEHIIEICGSLETADFLRMLRSKYSIENSVFIDLVGDTILKLVPRNTFEQSLISEVKLSPEIARSVTQELKSFFDKAEGVARLEANLETKERLDLRPRTEAPTPGANVGGGGVPKPLTREELMSALGGKRTMAQDIEALRAKREGTQGGE